MVEHGLHPDADDPERLTLLLSAIATTDADKVEKLLVLGANPDQRLPYRLAAEMDLSRGTTALIFAVSKRIRLTSPKQVTERWTGQTSVDSQLPLCA